MWSVVVLSLRNLVVLFPSVLVSRSWKLMRCCLDQVGDHLHSTNPLIWISSGQASH